MQIMLIDHVVQVKHLFRCTLRKTLVGFNERRKNLSTCTCASSPTANH